VKFNPRVFLISAAAFAFAAVLASREGRCPSCVGGACRVLPPEFNALTTDSWAGVTQSVVVETALPNPKSEAAKPEKRPNSELRKPPADEAQTNAESAVVR